MEIKWLEDFVTLAETSSFSRAADLRNVTQPAFSRRIKQLEAWLGVILISRATMPTELTPAGRNFLPVAQDTIRTFHSVREVLRPDSEAGLVRLAALHTLTVTFFADWLMRLEALAGPIGTSIIPDRGGIEANLEALVADEADIFLTYASPEVPFHLDQSRFESISIGTDRLIPLVTPQIKIMGTLYEGRDILETAAERKLVLPFLSYGFSSFFGMALGRLFSRRPKINRHTVHQNTISAGLLHLALAGTGVCWLPESLARPHIERGELVRASHDDQWTLELDIRLYRHMTPRAKPVEAFWRAAKRVQVNTLSEA